MSHRMQLSLALGTIVILSLILGPPSARADGVPLPPHGRWADVQMPGQKAIIVYDAESKREDLILSIKLLGTSPEAAWVVPVPSLPQVKAARPEWFVQLSDLTQPKVETTYTCFPCLIGAPAPGAERGGVEVLSRERVGVYDVAVLSAEEPGALLKWLNKNGYTFPEEGLPILDAYLKEGWYFVATRVLPGEAAKLEGDVQPLWLSFKAERPVYPMRLTSLVKQHMDVLIYVLADHRMEITDAQFRPEFAGDVTLKAVAAEGEELNALLTGRPYYVTKLRGWHYRPWDVDKDLYLQQAASDEPYRPVIYKTEFNPVRACYSGFCLGLIPAGLIIGLAVLMRRYSRQKKSKE